MQRVIQSHKTAYGCEPGVESSFYNVLLPHFLKKILLKKGEKVNPAVLAQWLEQ